MSSERARCMVCAFVFAGFLLPQAGCVRAGETLFRDDSTWYRLEIAGMRSGRLRRTVAVWPPGRRMPAVLGLLDSLGYFSPVVDSSADTLRISAGLRCVIDSVVIAGTPLDCRALQGSLTFPMDYDAGKVAGFSRQVLRLHARGGYPFARAALSVAPAGSVGERPGLVIDMTVDPDRPCVFGPLVLAGAFATKRSQLARDVLYREGTGYDIDRVERTAARLMSRSYIAAVTAGDPVLVAQRDGMESDSGTPVVVPLTIRDRSGLGLDGALGFERGADGRARLYGSLDFSLHNILGVGDRAALFYKGEKEGHRLALTLSKMHLASVPLLLSGEFGLEVRERQFGHLHGVLTGLLDIATRWRAGLAVRGHETTVTDSQSVQWTVYGGDFIVERVAEGYRRGVLSRQVRLLTGSSLVDRGGTASTRWNVELAAGAHVPFGRIHAVAARVVSNNLFTVEERLTPVELYRTGGNRTVRGYAEDQFAFRNAAWLQAEYGVYFSPAGSVYIFCDGGVGSRQSVTTGPEGRVPLLGYGVGIRLPVKIGEMALEWARNKDDGRGLGRVHVGFRNMVSSGISQ